MLPFRSDACRETDDSRQPRAKPGEILLLIGVAIRVISPYLLVIIAAVLGAWGIWLLPF